MAMRAAATALAHNPNVLWVEPDAKRYVSAETLPYGIPMVQAPQLSDAAAGEVLVCIIDSGYSGGHPDLPHGPQVQGYDDAGTGNWDSDENSHGTHVAGTIAAVGGNDLGVLGVLPNQSVPLQIVKVFGFVSSGLPLGGAITPVPLGLLIDMGHPQLVLPVVAILLALSLTCAGSAQAEARSRRARAVPAE